MPHKFDPSNKEMLVSSSRHEVLEPHRVMALIPLLAHHRVADIGCGPGYFAIPLGKFLFDGKVYALDVQQEMLDATNEELERLRLSNVETIRSTERKIPLEAGSLDGALAAFVLHEADNPKKLLQETLRCLRVGGWFALMEWHKREIEDGPPVEDLIEEADLRDMAQKVGFRFTSRHSLNDNHYMLLMRK